MKDWIFSPPAVFIIIMAVLIVIIRILSGLSFHAKKHKSGTGESYACGEDNYNSNAQPNYSQFFPYAFFFTLAHVATLIITTVPLTDKSIFILATMYILGAIVGLYVLLRK